MLLLSYFSMICLQWSMFSICQKLELRKMKLWKYDTSVLWTIRPTKWKNRKMQIVLSQFNTEVFKSNTQNFISNCKIILLCYVVFVNRPGLKQWFFANLANFWVQKVRIRGDYVTKMWSLNNTKKVSQTAVKIENPNKKKCENSSG